MVRFLHLLKPPFRIGAGAALNLPLVKVAFSDQVRHTLPGRQRQQSCENFVSQWRLRCPSTANFNLSDRAVAATYVHGYHNQGDGIFDIGGSLNNSNQALVQ